MTLVVLNVCGILGYISRQSFWRLPRLCCAGSNLLTIATDAESINAVV